MKKVLSVLLALCLIIGAVPMFASAYGEDEDFEIITGASGDRAVTGYHGTGGGVFIPDGIVAVLDGAFDNGENVTGLQLPESVRELATGALSGCTSLKKCSF